MSETAMAMVQPDTEDHQPENGFVSPETTSPGLLTRIDGCVLPFLGGFGKYQRHLIILTWIPAIFIGFSQYSDNFLLAQPNNTCVQPLANTTNLTRSHASLFNNSPHNSSTRPAYIYTNGSRGAHNTTVNSRCMCNEWTFELQTGLVRNVVTKWSLVCDSAWKVHIAKFSLLVGSIFGYLVFGVLADWFGRHPVLIISVFFMLVFGLTVAFSVNVTMFSTLRFFEGFSLAGITLSLYVLRIELCLPNWRFSMTMVANFVVLGGQLLMPGVAYLCRDWQVLQAIIICPLFLMLSYIWIFPESLRWLLATQQYCRSKWIMGHIAKKNQINAELDPDQILIELQRSLPEKPKKTCIVKMVGTRNLWKNIVVLCVNSLTGYGIHHCFARSMLDPDAQGITMFNNFYADYYCMGGIALASCLALCPAVGLMGRRGGLLMFMIITALASLLQLGLLNLVGKYSVQLNIDRSESLNRNFSIAFSIIGMFSSHAVSNLSIFFCAEITPTVIRGGGLGLVLASAGFGILTAPIMDLHNQKGYFLHHIIFACCTLICIICILLLPETRYQPLPETLADGEIYSKPLLPPRKPAEQRLLLVRSESGKEYTRVEETPLHEVAATTAVTTMNSTASSVADLTAASVVVVLAPPGVECPGHKDLNGRSLAAPLAGKECMAPLSSTPLHKAPPSSTDPLLPPAEDSAALPVSSIIPSDDLPMSLVSDSATPLTKDSPGLTGVQLLPVTSAPPGTDAIPTSILLSPAPVIQALPVTTDHVLEEAHATSTLDATTLPGVVTPPSSTLESSTPHALDPPPTSSLDSPTQPPPETPLTATLDSLSQPAPEIPLTPTLDSPSQGVVDLPPTSSLDSSSQPALENPLTPTLESSTSPMPDPCASLPAHPHESDPLPTTDCAAPDLSEPRAPSVCESSSASIIPSAPSPSKDRPVPLDPISPPPPKPGSPCVNDSAPSSPVAASPPAPPPPMPSDSGHTPAVDSSTPPLIDTVHTPLLDSTILPVTDIVQPSSLDCTTPRGVGTIPPTTTDLAALEVASSLTSDMECTSSSPIDSGLLVTDCAITVNSPVNGVASS